MQVTIIKQTVARQCIARVGDVLDLPDSEARLLVGTGKAVFAVNPGANEQAVEGAPMEGAQHRDPKTEATTRRGRKKG